MDILTSSRLSVIGHRSPVIRHLASVFYRTLVQGKNPWLKSGRTMSPCHHIASLPCHSVTRSLIVLLLLLTPYILHLTSVLFADELGGLVKKVPAMAEYLEPVLECAQKYQTIYPIDPIFALAIIQAESEFYQYAISPVGAGGPCQLMPKTAQAMELKVYNPAYLEEAWKFSNNARKYYRVAIRKLEKLKVSEAFRNMRRWKKSQRKANELFLQYRKELSEQVKDKPDEELMLIDQRFVIELAVDKMIEHLAFILKARDGDLREAAAAYNAGLRRVKKARGIPYIQEAVRFQNSVLNTYKEYQKTLEE